MGCLSNAVYLSLVHVDALIVAIFLLLALWYGICMYTRIRALSLRPHTPYPIPTLNSTIIVILHVRCCKFRLHVDTKIGECALI